ncbi:MAG TPA: alpha-L-arabinofuranosidase C-terminal domain-containing protein [Polyangiaceae bacterium]|nr:alpha-L-arabinofuranosidase C-terminal domain-containing protein [Polyangiaceae bacterium]
MTSEGRTSARLTLNTGFHVGPIDQRIFGGFLEHLGRAVYGGVYDPKSPRSDERGFRRDVLEALRRMRMPLVRYPGGNYVSAYDWKDTVGPRAARPRRPDYAWQSVESNQFGIGEFMTWCEALGTSPFLAVNLGTGDAASAGQLVEYCNLPSGTFYSDLRVQHGQASPYAVKLWGLGNELDGPWQAGHVPAEVYARRAFQASFLMKQLDSNIETVAAGSSGRGMPTYLAWDREVLETCWDTIDYISAHRYSSNAAKDSAAYLAEGVEIDRILADYAAVIGYVRGLKRSNKRVYLAFDEWNVWYRARHGEHTRGAWREAPPLLEEVYNLEDALVCAQYLTAFLRRADLVKIACLAQIVNVIAPVLTKRDALLLQSIYHPFVLFAGAAQGLSLTPRVEAPEYSAGTRGSVPVLDAAAAFDPESGLVSAFLVHRERERPLTVELRFDDRRVMGKASAVVLGGGAVQLQNDWDTPDRIQPRDARVDQADMACRVEVPAPGLAVVQIPTVPR